jgi:hypothetical protein
VVPPVARWWGASRPLNHHGPYLGRASSLYSIREFELRNATVRRSGMQDDPGVRETTAAILRRDGYVVIEAADGASALELLVGGDVDVVLLDLRLPRMDGPAVLEALDDLPRWSCFPASRPTTRPRSVAASVQRYSSACISLSRPVC